MNNSTQPGTPGKSPFFDHLGYGKTVLLVCLYAVLLTGCRPPEEINDRTLFSGASVDYLPDSHQYVICAEIMNPPANETETGESPLLYSSGHNIASAMNQNSLLSEKNVHWSHAKDLLLSKELAQTPGIRPVLDFLVNHHEFRLSTDLLIYDQGNACDFFQTQPTEGCSRLFQVENLLNRSTQIGTGSPMKAYEAINILETEGIQLTLPILSVSHGRPYLNGTAVFRGDRLVGQLTKTETQLLSFLQSQSSAFILTAQTDNHTVTAQTSSNTVPSEIANRTITAQDHYPTLPSQNDRGTVTLERAKTKWILGEPTTHPGMDIQLTVHGRLSSYETYTPNQIEQLERQLERQLSQQCHSLIRHIQTDLQSDILGIGRSIHDRFPHQWAAIKNNWDEDHFTTFPITVHCHLTLEIGETHV